jgi:hypothetical protein
MYYTIQNNNLIIAETEQALTRFYNNVLPLPSDYEKGKYIIEGGELILNPNWEEEKEAAREADFNKSFFQTSLGYVRRSVTMADGSHKDFLSDLLPAISMSVQLGVSVNILTYDKPPFDHDIDDWTKYQHKVVANPQFIQECFMQLSNDFLPINED